MDSWDRMTSWDFVLPPSRPSYQHLSWFRSQLLSLARHDPIAILGSTPELRDLVAICGFNHIYVYERNPQFLERMNRLRVVQSEETIVVGDWLHTLPRWKSHFAAVLSDLTSGNLPYAQHAAFYSFIADALRPGGIFCDKLLTHPVPHEPLQVLIPKYDAAPLNLQTLNDFSCEVFFCSDLLSRYSAVDTDRFYAHLRNVCTNPTTQAILARLPLITPPGMLWHYGRPWNTVRRFFDPRLHCTDEQLEATPSPYARRLRLLRWDKVTSP